MDRMGKVIEDFAKLIPSSQKDRSGKAFYSGRLAFEKPSDVYILGLNPGGDPAKYPDETVANHTDAVLRNMSSNWSAYRDEPWSEGRVAPGTRPMQRRVLYLFKKMGLNAGEVPASNLIFPRSSRKATLEGDFRRFVSECWTFHEAVIQGLGVRVVVCLGGDVGEWVCRQSNANRFVDNFVEKNDRRWKSNLYASSSGLTVAVLSHPSIAAWTNPATDPTDLVVNALN